MAIVTQTMLDAFHTVSNSSNNLMKQVSFDFANEKTKAGVAMF